MQGRYSIMARITIAYAAGKSGGHIIPCLTLFKQAQEQHKMIRGLFFTTTSSLDRTVLPEGSEERVVCRLPLYTKLKNPLKYLVLSFGLVRACITSMIYLLRYKPERIVTTGGLTAVPVCLMGYLLRIPIDLYELNAVVGRATRFLAPCATRIMICFPEAQRSFRARACIVTPYPVRFTLPVHIDQSSARAALGLSGEVPTIVVLGGSQGSVTLNRLVKHALSHYTKPIQVIHQTGSNDTLDWHAWYRAHNIQALVFPYHDDLAVYLMASDLVICRAGAGTLFESMAYKKKMIVIPLEGVADDHQVANAYACQRQYQECITLRQQRLDHHPTLLINTIDTLLYPQQPTGALHEYVHSSS
jgi:UDP-N-acetylglucosamine--N-acetylmuramyl-(pentapeptide) pyrophosphoryl-undecaprenol N-acetylglucosamine transferase